MADLKGLKRICMSCGARFYDLNKKPIICPSCNTEFTGEIKVKARRGRLPSEAADTTPEDEVPIIAVEEEDDTEVAAEGDGETVSLEEIDEDSDDADDDSMTLDDEEILDDDMDDIDDEDIEEDIAEEDEEK